MSALLLLAAALAAAAIPAGFGGTPPAADVPPSTAPAPGAPPEPGGAAASGAAPAPAAPRLKAVIHPEAKDWKPVSLRAGGDPDAARNRALLRRRKVKGKTAADARATRASARLHKSKDESWLVIAARVPELEARRTHLELQFRLVEGYVEEVRAVAVTAERPTQGRDSFELRADGVPFESLAPAEGAVVVSALDPRARKDALNAGTLKDAAFGGRDLGLVDLSWSVRGVR